MAGCGSGRPSGTDQVSSVDTDYASSVISHHAQTLALLDLTLGRAGLDPEIGTFADQARPELFAEVKATTTRLATWGAKVPRTALEHTHGDAVPYDTSIAGVLSNDQMHALEQTRGRAFERAWLRALIAHERAAVRLATAAVQDGESVAAIAAATKDQQVHEDHVAALTRLATR
jgi:uncharacterized protein (DUF305 family)